MNDIQFVGWELWAGFLVFVLIMLLLDMFVFGGNKAHKVTIKCEAIGYQQPLVIKAWQQYIAHFLSGRLGLKKLKYEG